MHTFFKGLLIWAALSAAAMSVGLIFGYAVDVGGRMTPASLKLAATMERGHRVSERLIGTLDYIINNCTWSVPK